MNNLKGENEAAGMVRTDTSFSSPQVTRESADLIRERAGWGQQSGIQELPSGSMGRKENPRLNGGWTARSTYKLPNYMLRQWCFQHFEWTRTRQDRIVLCLSKITDKARSDWHTSCLECKHEFQLWADLGRAPTWAKSRRKDPQLSGIFFRGGVNKGTLNREPRYLLWSEATGIIHFYHGVDRVKNMY